MLDINRLLGIEGIFEDPASLEALKQDIMNDVRCDRKF